ncbi:TPA: hypothetical protein HA265_02230, partial [Candidatus Woesearchaeota archaeon]|nr:hypothetical protein [Candidatus Woesearchaeota archaeon]
MDVVYESALVMNGLSQFAASFTSLLLALKLQKERTCGLYHPFFLLSASFFGLAVLNMLWFIGAISLSPWDHMIVGPLFNIVFLAILFYTVLFISGHRHLYLLLPLFLIGISTFLVFSGLAGISDIITGVALVGMFFYIGFIDHHLLKMLSLVGMVYGFLLVCVSVSTYLLGIPYLFSWWFIPTLAVFYLLFMMHQKGHVCSAPEEHGHVPVIVEVMKFGVFVIALSIFLILGTLGVHELGHSLAANAFGCEHKTSFGVGFAVTSVSCDSA